MGIVHEELNIGGNYRRALTEVATLSNQATSSMSLLGSVASSVGIGMGAFAIMEMSDSISMLNQRMKLAIVGGEDFSSVQDKLRSKAQQTRASYESLATTFSKLGMQTKGVFANNDEIIEFTGNLQKLFTVSGLDTSGIESTMYNLTQSLSSGALMGQDYRILKQNAPQMIQIIQDYYKVTRQELDDMVSKGKVSAQDIKKAMLDVSQGGMKEINEAFESMPVTFSQAMTMLGNSVRQELEPVLLDVAKLAQWLADHMDIIIAGIRTIAVYVGILTAKLLINKAVIMANNVMMWAWKTTNDAVALSNYLLEGSNVSLGMSFRALTSAMAANPFGLIAVAISLLVGVLLPKLIEHLGGFKATLLQIKNIAILVFENIIGAFARMIEGIVNTYRKVKSFFTGEKFEAYKLNVGYNEEAHEQRKAEIEAAKNEYKNKNNLGGLNFELDSISSIAQGQLTNSVKLADEDVKYISDLAERKYVMQVNVNTMPNVSINQNVKGDGASNLNDMEKDFTKILSQWQGVSNIV